MFQTFEVTSNPEQGPPRLSALRDEMLHAGLGAFIVPRADAHRGEYVAPADARLAWLTGFTGSAGFAVALAEEAAIFVDGRYRVQVRQEVDPVFTPVDWPETQLADWLIEHAPEGATIGFDPWLHTAGEIKGLKAALEPHGLRLTATENLVDAIWEDRPAPPAAPFFLQPEEFAGESSSDKRARLAEELRKEGQRAALLTLPDSIAWLLNIRGSDIPRNPVPHAFALLHDSGRVELFCGPGKADEVAGALGADVAILPADSLLAALTDLDGPVRVDPASAPERLAVALGSRMAEGVDPCLLPKAIKNPTEIAGMREAHLRDGAAMVRFLAWLDAEAPKGGLTETSVVTELESFRRATNALEDISFETIAGAGEHGAIVHYRVNEKTDRPVRPGELLLVDSGAQYRDGTTDITRTIAVGAPPEGAAEAYTRVLQGMVALSRARFPRGVTGAHLDALARFPLWTAGMDFDHGTGHGVGAYLCVHEGPARFSRASTDIALQPGMVLSNEPGHYREGAWGIRIENLVVVEEAAPLPTSDPNRPLLGFETLTFVPFDRRLIVAEMLSPAERDWIDAYHRDTLERIGPRLDGAALAWAEEACAPL
ncbi:aminopeptidase P family protein [Pseudoroseicyclus tamaricis]|uniref:Aminopeptidase P family protein n=1 Tax=Pseudoroseicyclus tamaricis TaxID=2705421 RepID=A0A6B2JUG2_9RHOB|nr:aminopeptidase P family protein [Pseudoroseicyclus tamaricis]NDV01700.1 aminopeptidase P family protein [Pseudoroseicyclus tamaricis]